MNFSNYKAIQKMGIKLVENCPLNVPLATCPLNQYRHSNSDEVSNFILSFDINILVDIINHHLDCISSRIKNDSQAKISKNDSKYLVWNCKKNIGILTFELKKRNWIKSQNEFAKLFTCDIIDLKIHWNSNHLYELAYLIYRLKNEGFINSINSKGYFMIVEKHIFDFNNNSFKKNFLVKLSSIISSNEDKYIGIINEVNHIIRILKE